MAKKTTTPKPSVTLDDLDVVSKDRLMRVARADLEAEMTAELRKQAKKQVSDEIRETIRQEILDDQKGRITAFLNDLVKVADRLATYLPREICDQNTMEEIAAKYQGLTLTRQQRMTVIGLISTIGYMMTCRPDGSGGERIVGRLAPNGSLLGFAFKGQQQEVRKDYAPEVKL